MAVLSVLHTAGCALGLALYLANLASPSTWRTWPRPLPGALGLALYLAHLASLSTWRTWPRPLPRALGLALYLAHLASPSTWRNWPRPLLAHLASPSTWRTWPRPLPGARLATIIGLSLSCWSPGSHTTLFFFIVAQIRLKDTNMD